MTYAILQPGDPAPWFKQRSVGNPNYNFDSAAGRYLVLCFFVSMNEPQSRQAIREAMACNDVFDDDRASFFGVSLDPGDETEKRVADRYPGYRFFWDFDAQISQLYGSVPKGTGPGMQGIAARRMWIVLDPTLRVMRIWPFTADGGERAEVFSYLRSLPPASRFAGFEVPVPIIILPQVFEPEFCRHLIGLYEENGGEESGFMREVGGKTVRVNDYNHKRRKDYNIDDKDIVAATQGRIQRRVVPEIKKVHQFKVTRMERYIVSCYAAEDGGHFNAHRDNTTKGTAHRRFAVSINLNDEFEGGEVSFPEYGPRSFKAPVGGAVVFSCSLLHAVSKVTRGRRYAFLPFLYDEAAAKMREENNAFLADNVGSYKK